MIRIMLTTYDETEKTALLDLLQEVKIMFDSVYCPNTDCRICDKRHVCYDVEKILEFMEKEVHKHDEKNS